MANVNLPYARRGWLAKQWKVTPMNPRMVVVRNTARYAAFVVGKAQQPFHKDRGWKRIDEEAKKLVNDGFLMRQAARMIKEGLK